jgi:hypothetical protein
MKEGRPDLLDANPGRPEPDLEIDQIATDIST